MWRLAFCNLPGYLYRRLQAFRALLGERLRAPRSLLEEGHLELARAFLRRGGLLLFRLQGLFEALGLVGGEFRGAFAGAVLFAFFVEEFLG